MKLALFWELLFALRPSLLVTLYQRHQHAHAESAFFRSHSAANWDVKIFMIWKFKYFQLKFLETILKIILKIELKEIFWAFASKKGVARGDPDPLEIEICKGKCMRQKSGSFSRGNWTPSSKNFWIRH